MMNYLWGSYYIFKNKISNWGYSNDVPRIEPKLPWYRQYAHFYSPASKIVNGLYLGSSFNAYDINQLNLNNIKVIINITHEIDNFHENNLLMTYYKFRIHDNNQDDITTILGQTYEIIERHLNRGEKVLVHCYMGASRSASVIIHYLMNKYNMTYEQAKNYVINIRPLVNLSFKFDQTLKNIRLLKN